MNFFKNNNIRYRKNSGRYKNRGNIKWGVGYPNRDGAKSSKNRYDNNIEDGNEVKGEYNNDMRDATGTEKGYDINMGDGNGAKGRYNNDIENGASKYNKYRMN